MKFNTCTRKLIGLSLAAAITGCHIPANSPLSGIAGLGTAAQPHTNVLPPPQMLSHTVPGVDGPGPGIIAPVGYEEFVSENGVSGLATGGMAPLMAVGPPLSQIGFLGPDGMQVRWDIATAGGFDSTPLVTPGRYDFPQGALYRLNLTNITGREGT